MSKQYPLDCKPISREFSGFPNDYRTPWITPSTDGRGAFQDPTHVGFWNSNSFWYYTRPEQAQFIPHPFLFESNRIKNFYPSDWHREHQIVYMKADLMRK